MKKAFMDESFLLSTETAKRLYYEEAAQMPIVDYHCHVSPKEIFEDRQYENVGQLWLEGDHYKWRLMRACGVEEQYITGNADYREKFRRFAACLPRAIGNPMFHWCHLELKRYFGYEGLLNEQTADEVFDLSVKKLKEDGLSVRKIIAMSGVRFIGTTDDPADSLEWHEKLAAQKDLPFTVAPSFRPDRALNLDKAGWLDYIAKLSEVCQIPICDMASLKAALKRRMEFFAAHGCRASDHGLDFLFFRACSEKENDDALRASLEGKRVTAEQIEGIKTELLLFCAAEYEKLGWVMQLHFNCLRNPNSAMLAHLGPDTGFDCIGPNNGIRSLAALLDRLYATDSLPKTVLYSLDCSDNAALVSLMGAFQGAGVAGKLQHGSAWWFHDHIKGMREQMETLASLGVLGNFIGMLTDSRSFLSYTRHEYFRRILCDLIGKWVENGEYPDDDAALRSLVRGICYENAVAYFGIDQ